LAYQPPASSTFLSEQTSHQQSASNTFLSEQISISHQPHEQAESHRPSDVSYKSKCDTAIQTVALPKADKLMLQNQIFFKKKS
jgi:hypothetical protein